MDVVWKSKFLEKYKLRDFEKTESDLYKSMRSCPMMVGHYFLWDRDLFCTGIPTGLAINGGWGNIEDISCAE